MAFLDSVRLVGKCFQSVDRRINRAHGGLLRHVGVLRHAPAAVILPTALVFFFINGPSLRYSQRLILAVVVALLSLPVFTLALRLGRRQRLWTQLLSQCALLAAYGAGVWRIALPAAVERDPSVYQHVLSPAMAVIAVATVVSAWRAQRAFSRSKWQLESEQLRKRMRTAPLGTRLRHVRFNFPVFLIGGMRAALSLPTRVLFIPAFAALLVNGGYVRLTFFVLLAVAWAVTAVASVDGSFTVSGDASDRSLFGGWPALVSFIVIALGVARVSGNQYISTVIEGARGYTIVGYLLALYVMFWWQSYWIENLITVRLLGLVAGRSGGDLSVVVGQSCVVQTHGSGRLLVIPRASGKSTDLLTYTSIGFADALAQGAALDDDARLASAWVRWRIRGERLFATVALAIAAGFTSYALNCAEQVAHIAAAEPAVSGRNPIPVEDILFGNPQCSSNQPVLAVAASGGGTRAALYTAASLERLHGAGHLGKARLLSGVSGGGVALTYFAAHRDSLLAPSSEKAWNDFFEAMAQPYIEDVIDGSGEWRLAGGVRLGRLLAESFERRWIGPVRSFGDVKHIGLMLNSSIAGRYTRPDSSSTLSTSLAAAERVSRKDVRSDVAGGRLVFTNLRLPDHFGNPVMFVGSQGPADTRDNRLPVFILNDPQVLLSYAAAANANFPPVFSNIPVDRGSRTRFWVTDGGAIDNRGTETLLMAIRYALPKLSADCASRPPLHVLEIEASGVSDGYEQDRGLGSKMAAGTAFASQLNAELLAEITRAYGGVRFHYLPMPALLRRSGSFGTHWMLQERVRVCSDAKCKGEVFELTGRDVLTILRSLNDSAAHPTLSPDAQLALDFIDKDPPTTDDLSHWTKLIRALQQ